MNVGRIVYATITLMSVLIVYDGWQHLRYREVIGIIVGPILAMFLAHVFAGWIGQQAADGPAVTRAQRADLVRTESRFLLLAVPPLALVGIFNLLGASLTHAINGVVLLGALSLGYWGGIAGRRSGMTGWRLALAVTIGLSIGVLILALYVFLQPGKALNNGIA